MQTRVYELSPGTRPAAVCRISSGPGEKLGWSDPRAFLLSIFLAIRSKRPSAPVAFSSGVSNQRWRNKARPASPWLDREQCCVFGTILVMARSRAKLCISWYALRNWTQRRVSWTPRKKPNSYSNMDDCPVVQARYLSMNNVRARSAQRPPAFERYASRARQRWRPRNARLKSHHGPCGAARAAKTSGTTLRRQLEAEPLRSQEELFWFLKRRSGTFQSIRGNR